MKVSTSVDIDLDYIYVKVGILKPRKVVTKEISVIAKSIIGLKLTEEGWYDISGCSIEDWICGELICNGFAYYRE